MSSNRGAIFVLILIGVISALAGIFGNVAASALPASWQPYLWLAWPLFIAFTLAGIGLAIWQTRRDPPPPALAPAPVRLPAPLPTPPAALAGDFAYDVFISYSSTDKDWVRGELLSTLEQAGLRVCIDFRDFQIGAPSVLEMERAVTTSRRTVLVLTPAYLASAWTEFEALMLQTLDAANRQRRLIPLLRQRCDLPLRINHLTYVNFVDPDDPAWAWRQLLTALGAAPAPDTTAPSTPSGWCLAHPYPMPPNFTGRAAERAMLSEWLESDPDHPLLVVNALGGFGKSALAWHWLTHDVDAARWPRAVWWSFYETESTFERFLAETLSYLGIDIRQYPGPRQQADALLHLLRQPGLLLILDGFERALRAYASMTAAYQGDDVGQIANLSYHTDCVSPIAEHFLRSLAALPGLHGKVLMTTRLTPRVLQAHGGDLLAGCREEKLEQMQPADAVDFFRSQGVRGVRAEIKAACAAYGFHPLSLRLLAGLIKTDMQQPGDIAAAKHLDVSGDLVQRQHHVLEAAYEGLPPGHRQLLSRIACFRGPVGYEALAAVAGQTQTSDSSEKSEVSLDTALRDLIDRGLLHRDVRSNRFDLHPIVRRYAYDRLTLKERKATHRELRNFFGAVPEPEMLRELDDLTPLIELYHHLLRSEEYDEAWSLYNGRLRHPLYYEFCAYETDINLLEAVPKSVEGIPRLSDASAASWNILYTAMCYERMGQPGMGLDLTRTAILFNHKTKNVADLASVLVPHSMLCCDIGHLREAMEAIRESARIWNLLEDPNWQGISHRSLGRVLMLCGEYEPATSEFEFALTAYNALPTGFIHGRSVLFAYQAQMSLMKGDAAQALTFAKQVVETSHHETLAREQGLGHYLVGISMVRSFEESDRYQEGAVLEVAEAELNAALEMVRRLNLIELEASVLLGLAELRSALGQVDKSERLAEEALLITERSGYVLQGADVHLFLAQVALDAGDRAAARKHAQRARQFATCDGPPDYTYRVAYEEAGVLLARLEEGR